ncbi:unnamed protein product [Penicillium glandicola]
MENRHHVPLSFDELMSLQHAEGLTDYNAWRQAMIQYHQQRDCHAATTTATTNPQIPLSESIHRNHPPVNAAGENHILKACNRDDPNSHERLKENTKRLVDCGVAESLCIDRTMDHSLFERPEISDIPEADAETKQERALEAHMRFWAEMGGIDKKVRKRRPQEPCLPQDTVLPFAFSSPGKNG